MSSIDYKDGPPIAGVSFDLPPEEAKKFFQAKGLTPTFAWQDMIGEEHSHAFTVAKMMDVDMLGDVHEALDRALSEGRNLRQFREEIIPVLQAKGWWGRKDVIDPMTGKRVDALLGSSARLQKIFRTNLQSAYAVGAWDMIQAQSDEAPYLLYDALDDHRTRPEHAALDGIVRPVDDPFWTTHYPPNGWNCRCGVTQYSADEMAKRGLSVSAAPNPGTRRWKNPRTGKMYDVPTDLDPGWDHNPGQTRSSVAQTLLAEKAAALPAAIRPPPGKTWTGDGYAGTQAPAAVTREQKAARLAAAKEAEDAAASRKIKDIADKSQPDPGNWKAQALAQLQKTETWQASPPAAQLGAVLARAKALKQKHATQTKLSGYKKNVLAGKPPTKAQKAALDQAPEDMRKAFLAKLGTAKANAEARKYLDGLASPGAPILEKAALKQMTESGSAAGMTAKELADQVKAQAAAMQAKAAQKAAITGYKKKAIAEKMPTDKQAAAFKALSEADQNALVAEIDAAKAAAAKAAQEADEAASAAPALSRLRDTEIHVDRLEKTGGQTGSNPGGTYRDRDTGIEWYVKIPDSAEVARNEVLAGKLYEAAGVHAPEVKMIRLNGKAAIASRIETARMATPEELARAAGVRENLTVDAWLANWDVVGAGYDNLQIAGGAAMRIDPGGALRYRAQGGQKGAAFGDSVSELDTLLDPNVNPQSAAVFAGTTHDQLVAGAARVLAVEDDTIRALVEDYGPADAATRTALADRLIARKENISERFPEARPGAAPPAPQPTQEVSKAQFEQIQASRGNGFTIQSDDLALEDHRLHLWHHTAADGTRQTRGAARLRGQALEEALSRVKGIPVDLSAALLHERVLTAIRGVGTHQTVRGVDVVRVSQARAEFNRVDQAISEAIRSGVVDEAQAAAYREQLQREMRPWIERLENAVKGGPGAAADWSPTTDKLLGREKFAAPDVRKNRAPWGRKEAEFHLSEIERGRLTETEKTTGVFGEYRNRILDDGTEVRIYSDPYYFALHGRVEVRTPGDGQASATRVKTAIEEALEISTEPPSPAVAEALYLRQIAHHRYENMDQYRRIDEADMTAEARRDALAQQLSEDMGVDDVRNLPDYQPDGRRQAFGQGHVHRYRPGLEGTQEWEEFQNEYRLHHELFNPIDEDLDRILESGGQMAPTTDKLRRGIPPGGESPEPDLQTGGASYFFTRIKIVEDAKTLPGFVWKAKAIARTDSVSYPRDYYGNVKDERYIQDRGGSIEDWKKHEEHARNEVIFKESMSLFDDLEHIVVKDEISKEKVLSVLRSHGYDEWVDGRTLDELVKIR